MSRSQALPTLNELFRRDLILSAPCKLLVALLTFLTCAAISEVFAPFDSLSRLGTTVLADHTLMTFERDLLQPGDLRFINTRRVKLLMNQRLIG